MNRAKFERLQKGDKVKIITSRGTSGHSYDLDSIVTVYQTVADTGNGNITAKRPNGTIGNYLRCEDVEASYKGRNAAIRQLEREIAESEREIAKAKEQIEWFKLYRDNLDKTIVKTLETIEIDNASLIKKIRTSLYKALKDGGCPVDFEPPVEARRVESLGGRMVEAEEVEEEVDDYLEEI